MTWPNTTVSTTHLDAGTDEPRLARADLKDAVDKLNTIITDGPTRGFVEIYFDSFLNYASNTRRRANASVNYQTGPTIVSRIRNNGEIEFQPGVYLLDLPQVRSVSAGAWDFTANIGDMTFSGQTFADGATPGLIQLTAGSPYAGGSLGTVFYANTVCSANLNYASTVQNNPVEAIRFTRIG